LTEYIEGSNNISVFSAEDEEHRFSPTGGKNYENQNCDVGKSLIECRVLTQTVGSPPLFLRQLAQTDWP